MHLKISPLLLLILVAVLGTTAVSAEDSPEQILQTTLKNIEDQQGVIEDLDARVDKAEGILQVALESRLSKARMALLEQNLSFVETVAEQENAGTRNDKHHQQAVAILGVQLPLATAVGRDIRKQITFPDEKLSAAEEAAAYSRVFELLHRLNHSLEIYIASLNQAEYFKLDVSEQTQQLKQDLSERAANGSVFLEMAISDVTALKASTAVIADDVELNARLASAVSRVSLIANGVAHVLDMMGNLEMDTDAYRQQLLSVTGQITTDFFQADVITSLLIGWGDSLWAGLIESGPGLFFDLMLFLVIVFAFYKLANLAQKLTEKALRKPGVKLSQLLQRMVLLIVRNVILAIGILIGLAQIGISMGPLLAGLGVIGFIIGFALQDTLSNFAAGMLILTYRPFDVGDLVEAGGVSGLVSHMSLVNTTILTLDNQTIIVPNGKIWGDVIKNVTAQKMRRVDLVFGISYTDDIPKTEKVLQEIIDSHESVLSDPEPIIRVNELGDSSVNFIVRPWVKTDDYLETYWSITRSVKMRFDEEGISIPFPQRDVHLYQT